jgi:hypothetical protein
MRHAASDDSPAVKPQDIDLFLPSAVVQKGAPCSVRLQECEFRLRFAQAHDALSELRNNLRFRFHLFRHKDRFARGVAANTRARTAIDAAQEKVDASAHKYRTARKALLILGAGLKRSEWVNTLRELGPSDIRHMGDAEASETEGRRRMSWIWMDLGISEDVDKDPGMHDGECLIGSVNVYS